MAHKTFVLVLCGQHMRTSFRHLGYKDVLIEDWSLCLVVGYLLPTEMLEIEGILQITLINGVFQILTAEIYQGEKRDLLPYTQGYGNYILYFI